MPYLYADCQLNLESANLDVFGLDDSQTCLEQQNDGDGTNRRQREPATLK